MERPKCVDFRIPPTAILLEMIVVPAGSCRRMPSEGSTGSVSDPPPLIDVPTPFMLGKYPVSLAQWTAISEIDDEFRSNAERECGLLTSLVRRTPGFRRNCTPAEGVTAEWASRFCEKLSEIIGIHFTLPTEDEWEYACRDGHDDAYPIGDPDKHPSRYYRGSTDAMGYLDAGPLPGSIPPNRFGLMGMQAYLPQWCTTSPHLDMTRPFVLRGGSRNSNFGKPMPPWDRRYGAPGCLDKAGGYGFRVRCEVPSV
jgi:formylglycine-generating enzyme required for sulfatase activity